MSDSPSDTDLSDPSSSDDASSVLRRWGRRAAWTVGAFLVGLLLLIGATLLVLQTESGATAAAQWLAGTVNPLPNTELTVERASGSWVRSLQLTNVTLSRPDPETGAPIPMAHVDTLGVRYFLWPLLRGRVHVERLSAAGPSITMRQAADSTWDWMRVLPASNKADTSAAMPVRLDTARITNGSFSAAFYARGRDSTARLRGLQLRAHDVRSDSVVTGRVDTLGLRGRLPDDTTDLRLAARGGLSGTTATLDTLQFDSPRSHVRGHGTVRLPDGGGDSLDDVSFRLRAEPLALQDLTLFAPTFSVNPQESLQLDVTGSGSGDRIVTTAEARFSEGGTLTARAAGTPTATPPPEGRPLSYQLDAEVQDVTTSLLGPSDSTQNRLNGTLSVDLEGPSLDALAGTADLRLTDTRWGDLQTRSLSLQTTVRDGAATIDLRGTLNRARLRATGQARPLDEAPSADVSATVEALNLAKVAPDAGVQSDLAATADLQAQAIGTDRQEMNLSITLDPSRIGTQRIVGGGLDVDLRPERVTVDGGLTLSTGTVEAAGFAALDGTERFVLETGRLDDLNVAALAGDTTASRLTGTAHIEGRGFTPKTMRLDATLSLTDSYYGPHRLSSLSTTASLDRGQITSKTDATLNGGTWTLAVEGTPFASTPTLTLTRGRFDNLDIGPFLADTTQSSRLHGTMRGTMRGTDPAAMAVDAGLTLDTSRVNQQRIDDASLDLRLRDGQFNTDLTLNTPDGGVQFAATARPFATVPTYQVTEGSFTSLDAGAFAALPSLSTALSGSLSLTARGATASTFALDADLSFTESRINDAVLPSGRVRATAESGQAAIDGQLALAGGEVTLNGTADSLSTTPSYALTTTADSLDLDALAGVDSLSAHLDALQWSFSGRGTDPSTLTASTTLSGRGMDADQFTLDTLAVAGTLRRGQLNLDTLRATSNAFRSTGGGTLALTDTATTSALSLRTELTDPAPLRPFVEAETFHLRSAVLTTNIYGSSPATQRFDGTLDVEGFSYNDLRLSEADLDFNGRRGQEQWLEQVELNGTLGYLSVTSFSAEETTLQTRYDGQSAEGSLKMRIDPDRTASLQAATTLEDEQTTVTLSQLDLQMQNDQWALQNEAVFTINDRYEVQNFQLQSGNQRIAANGVINASGTQNFNVDVEAVQLGPIAPLVGLSGVGGTVEGSIDLSGPATGPQLDSQLFLDLRTEDRDVGTLRLDAAYDDLSLDLDARLTHTDGSVLTAQGSLPTDLRLRAPTSADVSGQPVRFDVSTERFPLSWVDPFFDPSTVRNIEGFLAADVKVRGTLDAPELTGTASLNGGGAQLQDLGTQYHGATGTLRFTENRIVLEEVAVRSDNDGRLRATGTINVPKLTVGEFDLELDASDFIAIDTRAYRRALVDGRMTLRGTVQRPTLSGSVQVKGAEIFYNEALAENASGATSVALTEADRLSLENRFGVRLEAADTTTIGAYQALEMDLTVRIERNTWLRSRSNPEMDVQFAGDLELSKAYDEDTQIFGSIQVEPKRSTLRQFGQDFNITEGTVTFNGDPETPEISIVAVYEKRAQGSQGNEVRITLKLTGRPDDLTPTLTSDPPMDTRDILSYLATGRPANELLSGGEGGNGGGMATQMALGQASDFVENLAASELGLDVVRVQIRPSGLSYLTIGRYFTPRLFASIQQPVTTSAASTTQENNQYAPDLTLEYQLFDTLLLRALNNQQSLQLNLLFEYAY